MTQPFDTQSLSVSAKLALIGQLWDEIGDEMKASDLPPHIAEVARSRSEDLARNPESAVAHEEMWRRIDEQLPG